MNKEKEVMEVLGDDKNYEEVKTRNEDGHILILGKELNHAKAAKSINNLYQAEIDKLKAENERLRLHVRVLENELVNQ
jgi:hypothetical protein